MIRFIALTLAALTAGAATPRMDSTPEAPRDVRRQRVDPQGEHQREWGDERAAQFLGVLDTPCGEDCARAEQEHAEGARALLRLDDEAEEHPDAPVHEGMQNQ